MRNLLLVLLFYVTASLTAQDMPLTQVLIDGNGWEVAAEGFKFTDAACADAEGNFYFSDVAVGDAVYKIGLDGKVSKFIENTPKISGMKFGPNGSLYACQPGKEGRILAFDKDKKMSVIAENVQPNDLVVTHKGWVYFTETGKSSVTSVSPEGKVTTLKTSIAKPNGITLSPDQGLLAVSDHGGVYVWAYRIEADGSLTNEQAYMTMRAPGEFLPAKGDGMTTDAFSRYYVTTEEGLQMYDPTGRMGGVILKPQNGPMVSATFAGPGLAYLYVCSGDKIFRRKTKSHGILSFQGSVKTENYK
jgi:gluconolactonase